MARKRVATKEKIEVADPTSAAVSAVEAPNAVAEGVAAEPTHGPAATPEAARPATFIDPHATASVSLSSRRGGPSMHLLRSQKFNHYVEKPIMRT